MCNTDDKVILKCVDHKVLSIALEGYMCNTDDKVVSGPQSPVYSIRGYV